MATVKTKQRRKSMAGKGTVKVLEFMENQIRMMRDSNRLGTAYNYEKIKKNLTEFLEELIFHLLRLMNNSSPNTMPF